MPISSTPLPPPSPVTIPVLDHGHVRLIDWMGSDLRVVEAARVSYRGASKGLEADTKLIRYLWTHKHGTPFEQCRITLDLKMPIFVARQYIRHRMQSVNEVSARYTELPNEFYMPTSWRAQSTINKQGSVESDTPAQKFAEATGGFGIHDSVANHNKASFSLYTVLLNAGVAKELARMVLPVNIYTQFYATWDLRNLLHFISLREDPHAQWEHQQYGIAIKTILYNLFPITLAAFDDIKFPAVETKPQNEN